jgi:hypothetical protein
MFQKSEIQDMQSIQKNHNHIWLTYFKLLTNIKNVDHN